MKQAGSSNKINLLVIGRCSLVRTKLYRQLELMTFTRIGFLLTNTHFSLKDRMFMPSKLKAYNLITAQ